MSGGGGGGYQDEDSGGAMISDINVTPLVDITLVLLIIFMVTARLIVSRAIPVESPKTVSGQEVKTTLQLTLKPVENAAPQLYLNGNQAADRAEVKDYILNAVASNPEIQAVITADKRVPHGDVMELIDLVKTAGVVKFALTVEEKVEK